eukprot:gene25447-30726_t
MIFSRKYGVEVDNLVATFIEEQNMILRAISSAQLTAHHVDNLADIFSSRQRELERVQSQAGKNSSINDNGLSEFAIETNKKKDQVEDSIARLQLSYEKQIRDPLQEILAHTQMARNAASSFTGDGSSPSFPVMDDYGEATANIHQLTDNIEIMKSMIQSIKTNHSSASVINRPIGSLFGQLAVIEKLQPGAATRRQDGRQTTLPEALLGASNVASHASPVVLQALDQVISSTNANDNYFSEDGNFDMPVHPFGASSSSTRTSREVILLGDDSPQKPTSSSSPAHAAWGKKSMEADAAELERSSAEDSGDELQHRKKRLKKGRSSSSRHNDEQEESREESDAGDLPSTDRNRFNLDGQRAGLSSSRANNTRNQHYHRADYEAREMMALWQYEDTQMPQEDIEDEDSDSTYSPGEGSKGGRQMLKKRKQPSSIDASPQDANEEVYDTLAHFAHGATRSEGETKASSSSTPTASRAPQILVKATSVETGAAKMHSSQQPQPHGQGSRPSSSKKSSAGNDDGGVVDLT